MNDVRAARALTSRQRAYQRLRKTRAFQRWCEENPGPDRPLSAEELEILERLRQAGEEL